jgi:serine/threonine protein kinase
MLTTTGQLKVLDFGLARIETGETATQLTAAGSTVGTAAYMSPEQAAGDTVDARSDLWSLGVVTYEMLAGRPPFNGTSALAIIHAVLTETPPKVRTLRPDAPPELEAIVNRTLVRDRGGRTITAGELRDLAATYHTRLSSGQSAAVARPRVPRRRWFVAAIVAFAVAVGGVAWRMDRKRRSAGPGTTRCLKSSSSPVPISSTMPIASRSRRSNTSRTTHSSQNSCGRSPVGRSSSRTRLVRRCSIRRTAVVASLGGGLVPAQSIRGYRGACCTSRP